jgi:hypothetical protein
VHRRPLFARSHPQYGASVGAELPSPLTGWGQLELRVCERLALSSGVASAARPRSAASAADASSSVDAGAKLSNQHRVLDAEARDVRTVPGSAQSFERSGAGPPELRSDGRTIYVRLASSGIVALATTECFGNHRFHLPIQVTVRGHRVESFCEEYGCHKVGWRLRRRCLETRNCIVRKAEAQPHAEIMEEPSGLRGGKHRSRRPELPLPWRIAREGSDAWCRSCRPKYSRGPQLPNGRFAIDDRQSAHGSPRCLPLDVLAVRWNGCPEANMLG